MTLPFQPYNYPMNMNPMMSRNYVPTPPATLYIGNLDENVHDEQLYAHFSKYGPIHSVKIVKDRTTGRSRGFGYVNFFNIKDAESARMLSQYEKIGRKPIRILHKGDPRQKPEANLFVKNIDPSVTFKELHNYFSKCGPVVSVKIAYDKSGNSLGYGYVQFEKPEDADKAIQELNATKLKEQEIGVEKFKPRGSRALATNNNLYVRHLPEGSKEEIEKLLNDLFGKFGKVHSLLAISKDGKNWSAFVCYEDQEAAQIALDALNGKITLEGADQPLYVNLHASRDRRGQDQGNNANQNASLFIKNLRPEVTEEELLGALRAFGEIASANLKQTEHGGKKYGMAFVNFKFPQDAANAQTHAKEKEEVKDLFYEKNPYIGFLMNKEQRDQYKQLKTNVNTMFQQPNPYMQQKQMLPMQMYPPQFQPNFYQPNYGGMGPRFPPQNQMQTQQQMQPRQNWMGGGQYNQQQQQQQLQQPQQFTQQQQQYGQNYPRQQQQMYRGRQGTYGNQGQRSQDRPYQGQRQYQRPTGQGERGQNYNRGEGYNRGENYNRGGYDQNMRQNQLPNQKMQNEANISVQRPEKETTSKPTESHGLQLSVQNLKDKLDEFLRLDTERQRNILGEMLFPKVLGIAGPVNAPKITGMLVDFDVLSVQEILELLEDTDVLRERVQEAQELIDQEGA